MKTLTCIHAVVHLVVTGLSIFTQVARGWGFWESEGRWFIKRPPVFGLENPATRITQSLPEAGAAGTQLQGKVSWIL